MTIYDRPPRSSPFTITVGGGALNEWLGGWSANSAVVDNHSSQHVFLPDVNVYCPPRIVGYTVPLPALGRVHAQFQVPPGTNDGPPVAGQIALVTFYAQELAPNPGVPDGQVAVTIPRQKLWPDGVTPVTQSQPSFTVAAGATSPTLTFTLPPGTVQIRVLATAGGLLFQYALLVLGHQTVEQYWGQPTAPGAPATVPTSTLPFTIAVERDWDTQVDLIAVGDPAQATTYYVSALFGVESPGQAGAAQSVIIPTPAAWQYPNQFSQRLAGTFPSTQATARELVVGAPELRVYVTQLSMAWDAVAAGSSFHLVDAVHGSPGGGTIRADLSCSVQNPAPVGPLGPFTVGNSLYVFCDSGTVVGRGTISVGQGQ